MVQGIVRAAKDVDVNLPLLFNREPGTSFIHGEVGQQLPLYFSHVGYYIQTSDADLRGFEAGLVVQDFAENNKDGVTVGMGVVAIGRPHHSVAHSLIASAECSGAIEQCVFASTGAADQFSISLTNLHHLITHDMIDDKSVLNTTDGEIEIDAREYNSYAIADGVVVSVDRAKITVWANSTTVELWQQPTALSSMQDMVSMSLMIGALVAFIDFSTAVTSGMKSKNEMTVNDDGVTWFTCIIMMDLSTSALFIVALRVYHQLGFVNFRQHGLRVYHEHSQNIIVLVFMSIACAVVIYVGMSKKYHYIRQDMAADWLVLARMAFETVIVLAACSCAPTIAGTDFLMAIRFSTGMVINVIVGRDCKYLSRKIAKPAAIAVSLALLLIHITATSLVSPVFMLSQSFPNTSVFITVLSHVVCMACTCAGAALAPIRTRRIIAPVTKYENFKYYEPPDTAPTLSML